jgi:uncharacterized protein
MGEPTLARIRIYPVKSLDPVELKEVEIGTFSLRNDREFAMLAGDGSFINGKRTGKVNQLKANYDLPKQLIQLSQRSGGKVEEFHLVNDKELIEKYLSDFFGTQIYFLQRTQGELMDIPRASSVTIVSEASLLSLQKDIPEYTIDDLRLRFRANLELSGIQAFEEEWLFGDPGIGMRFRIGEVEMIGISPRARCNVPPRDPFTGETDKAFVKNVIKSRKESLPENSRLPKFGNFYQLTVNTYLPETEKGKILRVGDSVQLIEPIEFGN